MGREPISFRLSTKEFYDFLVLYFGSLNITLDIKSLQLSIKEVY